MIIDRVFTNPDLCLPSLIHCHHFIRESEVPVVTNQSHHCLQSMSKPFDAPFIIPDLIEVVRVNRKIMIPSFVFLLILLIEVLYAADVWIYSLYPRIIDGDFSHQILRCYLHVETLQMMAIFEVNKDGGIILERDPIFDDVGDVQAK